MIIFFIFFVSLVSSFTRKGSCCSSSSNTTSNQPQYSNTMIITASTYSSTSVSTRVRQRKQARIREQVNCCRELLIAVYEVRVLFYVSFFPHFCCSVFVYSTRYIHTNHKANQQLINLDFFKYGWHSALWRAAVQTIQFLVGISVWLTWPKTAAPSISCHFNHMFHASYCCVCSTHRHPASTSSPAHPVSVRADSSS